MSKENLPLKCQFLGQVVDKNVILYTSAVQKIYNLLTNASHISNFNYSNNHVRKSKNRVKLILIMQSVHGIIILAHSQYKNYF
jgi:hypothetical protein